MRKKLQRLWLLVASRNRRVLLLDLCLLSFAIYIGYALRLTFLVQPTFYRVHCLRAACVFPLCVAAALYACGLYRVYWPQASVEEYARLARAYLWGCALFLVPYFAMRLLFERHLGLSPWIFFPRSSLALSLFAGILFIGVMRASWRFLELAASRERETTGVRKRALVVGAGEAGAFVARDLQRHKGDLFPVGFIDEDPHKLGKSIAGLPVLGGDVDISRVIRENGVAVVLIAIPSASGANVRKYLEAISDLGVEVRVMPSLHELAGGRVEVGSFRSVELRDLLRREPIRLDEAEIGTVLRGKRVLITGAGGSIGSEICMQTLAHAPSELLLLGHGEQSIYNLLQRLSALPDLPFPCRPLVADIADRETMRRIFLQYRPQVVFHAAAHKHVPLMEENPREALRVNALGTWTLADLSGTCGAERFVMISTDKAVHPTSVMGATKRVAERLLSGLQEQYAGTSYLTVRFGNVLGSRGSVVPLFERQIRNGGPVTVTHPEMRRYFMLIPEAVSLVLQAASMGRGGELYVLDMGEPVRIAEMAETLIRLHGRVPHSDIRIVYTGIRPGEKLFEELFYDPDHVDRTRHDKIFLSILDEADTLRIDDIREALATASSDEEMRRIVFALAGA